MLLQHWQIINPRGAGGILSHPKLGLQGERSKGTSANESLSKTPPCSQLSCSCFERSAQPPHLRTLPCQRPAKALPSPLDVPFVSPSGVDIIIINVACTLASHVIILGHCGLRALTIDNANWLLNPTSTRRQRRPTVEPTATTQMPDDREPPCRCEIVSRCQGEVAPSASMTFVARHRRS